MSASVNGSSSQEETERKADGVEGVDVHDMSGW
jgi:hypothetical protein